MMNNFIGGGQIFLHKVRMLKQVIYGSIMIALISSVCLSTMIHMPSFRKIDFAGLTSYYKAYFVKQIDGLYKKPHTTNIRATADGGFHRDAVKADYVLNNSIFKKAHTDFIQIFILFGITVALLMLAAFSVVFLFWSRYGKSVQTDRQISGDQMLNASSVAKILRKQNLASYIKVGLMPLVRDMETHHMLICGSTGSGKTNLIHNILPFVRSSDNNQLNDQPAVIVDTTGEMISRYYDQKRGDIILNPCDQRAAIWDFWSDIMSSPSYSLEDYPEELEQFSKILFGFKQKSGNARSDPFFDDAAEDVFKSIVTVLHKNNARSLRHLHYMAKKMPIEDLRKKLQGTSAISALSSDAKGMASSVRAVLAQTIKPLGYLRDIDESDDDKKHNIFSLKEYFQKIDQGSKAWLFISTPITQREVLMPLVSCYLELSVMNLMKQGASHTRRVWFIIDELASLGNLPGFYNLIKEGRKYGACAIASMQSINQLYHIYGQYVGSSIFGQFATRFFFRTDEPLIAKMISSMCGDSKISKQQKNTSFGANQFRDGQSYTEQEKQEQLVQYNDLTKLADNQCFVLLPNTKARLSKIDVPLAKVRCRLEGFVPQKNLDKVYIAQDKILSDTIDDAEHNEDIMAFDNQSHDITNSDNNRDKDQLTSTHKSLEIGF